MNPSKMLGKLFVGLAISFAMILLTFLGMDNVYSQSVTLTNNSTVQQHTEHILDNLVISEHIPLTGQLASGDYILLMDFTSFVTSIAVKLTYFSYRWLVMEKYKTRALQL